MTNGKAVLACVAWAAFGLLIASAGSPFVNDAARMLVLGATTAGVGAALLAANLLRSGRRRAGLD